MPGPFVHQIDPIIGRAGPLYLWWYGLSYTLGFLGVHLWLRRVRGRLGMTLSEVYSLSIYLAVGVLLGGRVIEVAFYEWEYYAVHKLHILAFWLGGMSTHGLLLGGLTGTWLFCRRHGKSFLAIADELVIPGAWVMGVGRLGNFIDGQIAGSVTGVWWAVQFPDLAGFRHPVVLYDGVKNLLLIPLLLWVRGRRPPPGVVMAHFLFWYAFLRLFVDLFREYRVLSFGLGVGQVINLTMAAGGLLLLAWFHWRGRRGAPAVSRPALSRAPGRGQRAVFAALLLGCLVMPSDWTQDIPARYGKRHPGLTYSRLYPRIAPAPAAETDVP